jgi:hypothetical protein
VSIVLAIPQLAELAILVAELIELGVQVRASRGRLATKFVQAIEDDAAQPGAEGAAPTVVLEVGDLADHDGEDLLHHILDIGALQEMSQQPAAQPGLVDGDELLPRQLVRLPP